MNLSAFSAQVQAGLSASERVFALIDAEANVRQNNDIRVGFLRGEIQFDHVNFQYSEQEPVLQDFSLHIQPGETIALVGHTGAGKSSIAKLIARFYEFQSGEIKADGIDIRSLELESYRAQLGIVSQIPFLFSGTVAENICYACPSDATKAEIASLASQIGEGEWLNSLPEGLDTEVGERGARLSMGQRQMVSLMRVLVQRPAIFILDEATASIDPFTEWQIQQALNMILHHTTSILIAHRLSTVKAADRIIVLEEGKIIEEGSHESLLARGGHYAVLYNTYFRHQSLDYKPDGVDEFLAERQAYQLKYEEKEVFPERINSAMYNSIIQPGYPDFLDLPWSVPLTNWEEICSRLEDLPRGLSRHSVVFVNYSGKLFAIKELSKGWAEKEFELLRKMEAARLPVVTPVGYFVIEEKERQSSALITCYLDRSLPYRSLFMSPGLVSYREHLLDAIAGLLVQLHLAGIYWGDCSLSNTLFRRDAGALQAYLVDAETAQAYQELPALQRYDDLLVMEENIDGDLLDLSDLNLLAEGVPVSDTGAYIRVRYQRLWEEITHEDIINPEEHYRIQERIRALNQLGFSVGDVELSETGRGEQLRLKVMVSDRNFHHDQLHSLTGIDAQERQARQMMNEIQELKATLSKEHNRSTPLSVAAYYWLENVYQPVINRLKDSGNINQDLSELYCQVLEHKWYLSERAKQDVGHHAAAEDYIQKFGLEEQEWNILN